MMNGRMRRMGLVSAALAAGLVLTAASPGDMSVATFLQRAKALQRLGPLALAMPETDQLKGEVIAAGKRYQARIEADRKAGRKSASCPPKSGTLTPEQWLAHLRTYPPQSRSRTTINMAFDGLMRKRYPCPA